MRGVVRLEADEFTGLDHDYWTCFTHQREIRVGTDCPDCIADIGARREEARQEPEAERIGFGYGVIAGAVVIALAVIVFLFAH